MPEIKERHTQRWFTHRIGQYIIRNNNSDLLNPPVLIASAQHAKALHLSQSEKNYTYSDPNQ